MKDVSNGQYPTKDENFCTVEATVVTGFEPVAAEEAEERFGTKCKILKGRISIKCPVDKVEQVKISMVHLYRHKVSAFVDIKYWHFLFCNVTH